MATLRWPFRHAMVLALVLATLTHPLRMRLPQVIRTRRFLAATDVDPADQRSRHLHPHSHCLVQDRGLVEAVAWVHALPLPDWAKTYLDPSSLDLRKIESGALSSEGDLGLWFLAAGKGVASIGLQLLVLVIFLFYFLVEGEHLMKLLRKASPLRRDQEDAIIARFKAVSQTVLLGGLGTRGHWAVTGIGL